MDNDPKRVNANLWNSAWGKYDECHRVLKFDPFPGGAFVMTGGLISAMEFAYFVIAMRHVAPELPKMVFNVDTVHSLESCVAAADHDLRAGIQKFESWSVPGDCNTGKEIATVFLNTNPVYANTPGLNKMLRTHIERKHCEAPARR